MPDSSDDQSGRQLLTRGPELAVAIGLALLALLVIADSLRVGVGWSDDGPRSGTFPFYAGLGLLGASLWTGLRELLAWRRANEVFASHEQLRLVGAMLLPLVLYVAAIRWLGLYVASALLLAYFMRRHGAYGWAAVVAFSLAVPLIVYAVFERWFLVPMPKGPLESLLGL